MGMGMGGVVGGGHIGEQTKSVIALLPIASTGAVHNGADIDRRGFGAGVFFFQGGAATGSPSPQTCDGKIQDSAAGGGSGYTDSTAGQFGAVAITQQVADNFGVALVVDFRGMDRYVRPVTTTVLTGGSSPTWPISVSAVLAGAAETPTS